MTFLNRRMLGMALTIFVLDRLSKYAVVEAMELKTIGRIDIWEPYLTFRMAWNQGVNFGMFNLGDDGWWILIVIAAVIVGLVLYWARHATGWMIPLATGAVVGGAIGNSFDRLTYGAVADFLNMSCCGLNNPFAFNIADIAIFCGAAVLIFKGDLAHKSR